MNSMNLEHSIEALLFWKGEPVAQKDLIKSLSTPEHKITETEIHEALLALSENLKGRGIVLLANEDQEYMLGTSSEASALIERLTKEELNRDLGKASLETLSIIIYQGPIKRSQIDYIRGVNSTFILRNLLIRGLIEKKPAPDDNRTSIYTPSFKLLSYLGVSRIEDLPNFEAVKGEIEKFRNAESSEAEKEAEKEISNEKETGEHANTDTDGPSSDPEEIAVDDAEPDETLLDELPEENKQ
jgi:segregation and condensation protein B